jgi:hypothetical protein
MAAPTIQECHVATHVALATVYDPIDILRMGMALLNDRARGELLTKEEWWAELEAEGNQRLLDFIKDRTDDEEGT